MGIGPSGDLEEVTCKRESQAEESYSSYGPDSPNTETIPMTGPALRVVRPLSTIWLRVEAPKFVPANLVQSDIGLDKESGQLMSVSQDSGSSVVVLDRLKKQQITDTELCKIWG